MATPVNRSIVHGLELLTAVLKAGVPCGSRQLARDLGMAQAKVVRLTTTLCAQGLLRRTADGRYRAGPGLHVLAGQALVGSGLLAAVMPTLKELHAARWTVALGVLWQREVCYLVHARPRQDLAQTVGVHHLVEVERSSLGQVLVAHAGGMARRQAAAIHKAGHARIDFPDGTSSFAVAIGAEPVAALGVSRKRVGERTAARIVGRLHQAAAAIAAALDRDDRDA